MVQKVDLERWLAEGLSLEQIGRLVGRHPSTVSYWLTKHGLRASGRESHRPRGAVPRHVLAQWVEQDLSVRQIAERISRSPTTTRYWLEHHGLRTTARGRGRRVFPDALVREPGVCNHHGAAQFVVRTDGSRTCVRCRIEAVTRWRQRAKRTLVQEAGGACVLCGYDRLPAALQFHHVDPDAKSFAIGGRGLVRSLEALRAEAAKCVLLCANCHVEVEHGHQSLPSTMSASR